MVRKQLNTLLPLSLYWWINLGVFMIELNKVDFWKRAIEAISVFIPEGNFRFSDNGIYFKAIDPSQIVLVDYFIDKKSFDKYDIEPNFVGIDLVEFNKLMQRCMSNDKLSMDVNDAEMKVKLERIWFK